MRELRQGGMWLAQGHLISFRAFIWTPEPIVSWLSQVFNNKVHYDKHIMKVLWVNYNQLLFMCSLWYSRKNSGPGVWGPQFSLGCITKVWCVLGQFKKPLWTSVSSPEKMRDLDEISDFQTVVLNLRCLGPPPASLYSYTFGCLNYYSICLIFTFNHRIPDFLKPSAWRIMPSVWWLFV